MQEEICRVLYTIDIQYTGSIEHSQISTTSSMDQPSCPVCLGIFHRTFIVVMDAYDL